MKRSPLAALLALPFAAAVSPLGAAPLDAKQPLICATLEVQECDPGLNCERHTVEEIDIPQFLQVSFTDKQISGTRPSGEAVNAAIEVTKQTEQRVYLQGVTAKLGWTVNISTATGKMTLVAADDTSGYVAFGACTAR